MAQQRWAVSVVSIDVAYPSPGTMQPVAHNALYVIEAASKAEAIGVALLDYKEKWPSHSSVSAITQRITEREGDEHHDAGQAEPSDGGV